MIHFYLESVPTSSVKYSFIPFDKRSIYLTALLLWKEKNKCNFDRDTGQDERYADSNGSASSDLVNG